MPVFPNPMMHGQTVAESVAYTIGNSIYLNGSSDYLHWTPSGAGDDPELWTVSFWVKPFDLSGSPKLFSAFGGSGSQNDGIDFYTSTTRRLRFTRYVASTIDLISTQQLFRDNSGWTHIVVAYDSSQGTDTNKVKFYVNGVQLTDFSDTNWPALDQDSYINGGATLHTIGRAAHSATSFFKGGFAEFVFIDGTAYQASDFGTTDSNGVWQPKDPTGLTFGTNGFYLDFSQSGSLGTDAKNSNNWTVVGCSHETDSPTNNQISMFPTAAYLGGSGMTFSDGNRAFVCTSNIERETVASLPFPKTGKWYVEFYIDAIGGSNAHSTCMGLVHERYSTGNTALTTALTNTFFADKLIIYNNNTGAVSRITHDTTSDIAADYNFSATDVIQFAYDADNDTAWIGKNDTWWDCANIDGTTDGDPANNTNGATMTTDAPYVLMVGHYNSSEKCTLRHEDDVTGTIPTGFSYLTANNIRDVYATTKPANYFDVITYDGDADTVDAYSVTGIDFQPDMVWIKNRDTTDQHKMVDDIRDATYEFEPDDTSASTANADGLVSFDSGGFTLGDGSTHDVEYNTDTEAYVAWCFKEFAGFYDMLADTGATGAHTVAHSLGVEPDLIIRKSQDVARGWPIYHKYNTTAPETDYLVLHTDAATVDDNTIWNDAGPDSSNFTVGTDGLVNTNLEDYMTYLFANYDGLCHIGVYTGNGNANGTFANCGFRPRWVMIKRTNTTSGWAIFDSARDGYNGATRTLYADQTLAEDSNSFIDFTANGFKNRSTQAVVNASGSTYVYIAIAEHNDLSLAR